MGGTYTALPSALRNHIPNGAPGGWHVVWRDADIVVAKFACYADAANHADNLTKEG